MNCQHCGSTETEFWDGATTCAGCGTVLEDSAIVSDITFAENSAGGAIVQGSFIGGDQVRARTVGPGGFRGNAEGESRAATIQQAKQNIQKMAQRLHIPHSVAQQAARYFSVALDGSEAIKNNQEPKNFVLGRHRDYTTASCLYVACRKANTTHMLIDFADCIDVNVFTLGRSYLRLLQCLYIKLPAIDPIIYLNRFAALLEFGDETQKVVEDAVRLMKRFTRDWMVQGRRPAGLCGACLLLAARMNHFRRSISEIVQVVKIADVTLRARLEEFKNTPSGQLTVEDFRSVWLEEEQNPPAYYLNSRERGGEKNNAKGKSKDDNGKGKGKKRKSKESLKKKNKKKLKSLRGQLFLGEGEDEDNLDDLISDEDQDEDEENDADEENEEPMRESSVKKGKRKARDDNESESEQSSDGSEEESDFEEEVEKEKDPRHIQAEQIAEDEATNEVRRFLDDPELQDFATEMNGMDRAARRGKEKKSKKKSKKKSSSKEGGKKRSKSNPPPPPSKEKSVEQDENQNVSNEQEGDDLNANRDPNKNQGLDTIQKQPVSQLEENDGRNRGEDENDPFLGLDETELDRFILSPEEVAIKERVWVEFNKDYLEMALTKQLQLEQDLKNGITRKPTTRRKREKPRDSSTAAGSSAAEAAKSMMEKKKWSKRINYGAVQGLFDTASSSSKPSSSKRKNAFEDSDEDDDEDDIIEEEGGLPSNHPSIRKDSAQRHRIREREKEQRRSRSNSRNAGGATSQSEGDDNVGKQLTDTETEAHTDGDLNDEFGQQEDYDETVGDDYWD